MSKELHCSESGRGSQSENGGGDSSVSSKKDKGSSGTIIEKIQAANSCVSLLDVMKSSGFNISHPQPTGWSLNIPCPLKNHKHGAERTASFGYSYKDDRFYCLGCRQSGKAVEFLSGIRSVPRIVIANEILSNHDSKESIAFVDTSKEIKELLIEFSLICQNAIRSNKSDPIIQELLQKPILWIDAYLLMSVPRNKVSVEDLKARLDMAKKIIQSIETL